MIGILHYFCTETYPCMLYRCSLFKSLNTQIQLRKLANNGKKRALLRLFQEEQEGCHGPETGEIDHFRRHLGGRCQTNSETGRAKFLISPVDQSNEKKSMLFLTAEHPASKCGSGSIGIRAEFDKQKS